MAAGHAAGRGVGAAATSSSDDDIRFIVSLACRLLMPRLLPSLLLLVPLLLPSLPLSLLLSDSSSLLSWMTTTLSASRGGGHVRRGAAALLGPATAPLGPATAPLPPERFELPGAVPTLPRRAEGVLLGTLPPGCADKSGTARLPPLVASLVALESPPAERAPERALVPPEVAGCA